MNTAEAPTVYRPPTDRPAGAEPLFHRLVTGQRKQLAVLMWIVVPLTLVMVMMAFLDTYWAPAGGLFTVAFLVVVVVSLVGWFGALAPARELLGAPFREVPLPDGQLLAAGNKLSFPVGAGPGWCVGRFPSSWRLAIERDRRVWVLGPSRRGRVVVLAPGGLTFIGCRVCPAPADGSRPVARAPWRWRTPQDDPVLAAHLARMRRQALIAAGACAALAFGYVVTLAVLPEDVDFGFGALAGLIAATVIGFVPVLTFAGVRRQRTWTPVEAIVGGKITIGGQGTGTTTGQVLLPDGRRVSAAMTRVPIDLLVNVRDTRRLWIAGVPEPGRTVFAGLPGYPVVAKVKLGT